MSYGVVEAFALVERLVRTGSEVAAGMERLLALCERSAPHEVWTRARELDFAGDAAALRVWLAGVLAEQPPSAEVAAYWFGLAHRAGENQEESCQLYLSGSTCFDPADPMCGWACWTDDTYLPEGRYADSPVLRELYRLVKETDVALLAEYALCLGYAALAVREACAGIGPHLLLGSRSWRGVAVGFDEGDFLLVGMLEAGGIKLGV